MNGRMKGLVRNGKLTTAELAYHFGVSRQTIHNWIKSGWLPAEYDDKVTFMYYIKESDLDDILNVGERWFPGYPVSRLPELVYKSRKILAVKEHNENA
jgi:DNA-binding XRE family transcriptional regulator